MQADTEKIDQAVLALLSLGMHEGTRAWKSFDWEVMGRLHAKGYISDPVGKAKSVVFTEEGLRESARLSRFYLVRRRTRPADQPLGQLLPAGELRRVLRAQRLRNSGSAAR
jgi:hypothetical protein